MKAVGLGGCRRPNVKCLDATPLRDSASMVFVLCGDQHLCRLSVRPFAGARDCFLASIPRRRHDCFLRIRRSSRSGIDLERSKLGGHDQASFRQPDLRVADGGNIRLAMAEIALVASRLSFKLSKSGRYTY